MKYKIFSGFIVCIITFPSLSTMENPQALLRHAIYSGDVEFVRKCLANGAKAYEKIDDNDSTTLPLFLAVKLSFPEITQTLIDAGAPVNIQDAKGKTPLHYAVQRRHSARMFPGCVLETMNILIEAGAMVNIVDNKGQTPLMKTIGSKHRLTEALLNAGASTLPRRFKDEKNILDLAIDEHVFQDQIRSTPYNDFPYFQEKIIPQTIILLSERQRMEIMPHLNGTRQIGAGRKIRTHYTMKK